jgi:mono/diheme cytochrome c family protein
MLKRLNCQRDKVAKVLLKRSFLIFSGILVVAALGLVTHLTAIADQSGSPDIQFDSQIFDFGTVDEGARINHTFKVSNKGTGLLKIVDAYASCGCTVPKFARKTLEPGETTDLFITVDTSMKQNGITKTVNVSSNDPKRPIVQIALKMFVRNQHKGLSEGAKAKILTDESCAGCHVARGVGAFGIDLYVADCAMCHGPKAEGESGPTLIGPYDNAVFYNHMRDVLVHGSKKTNAMPGFGGDAGGPLAQRQIDSLLTYLKDLSSKRINKK